MNRRAAQQDFSGWPFRRIAHATGERSIQQNRLTPLNPRRRPLGRCLALLECFHSRGARQQFPVRQFGRTTGSSSIQTDQCRSHASRDAPEPDSQYKRTTPPNRAAKRHDHTAPGALPGPMIKPNSGLSAIQTKGRSLLGHLEGAAFIVCKQTIVAASALYWLR